MVGGQVVIDKLFWWSGLYHYERVLLFCWYYYGAGVFIVFFGFVYCVNRFGR